MGLGPMKNGRNQPITPYASSWAATVNQRVAIKHDAFRSCQQILQGEGMDRNLTDAAREAIEGYRSGKGIDRAVAEVLFAYATKIGAQDRWGK